MSSFCGCENIADFLDVKVEDGCCMSCHEDSDERGYNMCAVFSIDGRLTDIEVCCTVRRAINERLKDIRKAMEAMKEARELRKEAEDE